MNETMDHATAVSCAYYNNLILDLRKFPLLA